MLHSHSGHGCSCPFFLILRDSEVPGAGFAESCFDGHICVLAFVKVLSWEKAGQSPVYTMVICLGQEDFSPVQGGQI